MKTTIMAAAVAIASLSALAPARADNWQDVPQIQVPYGDLNLSSVAGAKVMLQRIKAAASRVCGGKPDLRFPVETTRYRRCVKLATETAIGRLNARLVAAIYYGNERLAQEASR